METLVGEQFVATDGTPVHISEVKKAKVVLLYFAAVWCPPCVGFKAICYKFYKDINKNTPEGCKNVEIILCPCEDNEDEYKEHLAEIPWIAIPFGDPRVTKLQDQFEVDAIPVVLVIKRDGGIGCHTTKMIIQKKGVACLPELIQMSGE
jgi:nucleoredoxin